MKEVWKNKVVASRFDPFRNRLARDIRNNLSKTFLQALADRDTSAFHHCGARYLRDNPAPVYADYVNNRIRRYEEAFDAIERGRHVGVLARAGVLWGLGLYFEMHELLEVAWKKAEGDRRRALQGLIRAAGMKIHAENNNKKAAASMGAKALSDLLRYPGELSGFPDLEALLAEIKKTISRDHHIDPE